MSLTDLSVPSLLEFIDELSGVVVEFPVFLLLTSGKFLLSLHEFLVFELLELSSLAVSFVETSFSLKVKDFLLEKGTTKCDVSYFPNLAENLDRIRKMF